MAKHETFRQEYVKCGKQCGKCPHGPYWYAYWSEGGRVRKRYVGKKRNDQSHESEQRATKKSDSHPYDYIFSKRHASVTLALAILGLNRGVTLADAKKAYRKLCLEHHPDRGGEGKMLQWIAAAWSWLQASSFFVQ